MDIFRINERVSGGMMMIFLLRAACLFAGAYLIWHGLVLLWELRPIRRRKFTTVVTAKVVELNRESRSASMNSYYLPRFEYEQDGELRAFSPKRSYRPCRLKLGGEVTLCLREGGKFRTIRRSVTLPKALLTTAVGIAMVCLQILI